MFVCLFVYIPIPIFPASRSVSLLISSHLSHYVSFSSYRTLYSLKRVVNVEAKVDTEKGTRYLLELVSKTLTKIITEVKEIFAVVK